MKPQTASRGWLDFFCDVWMKSLSYGETRVLDVLQYVSRSMTSQSFFVLLNEHVFSDLIFFYLMASPHDISKCKLSLKTKSLPKILNQREYKEYSMRSKLHYSFSFSCTLLIDIGS